MQRHKSAMKAARNSLKRNKINSSNATRVRKAVKSTRETVESGSMENILKTLPKMVEILDRMSRRGIIHRNKAARLKSRITRQANAAKE